MKKISKMLVLEGHDNAGKTTHIELLSSKLKFAGFDVCLTREPGGTNIGERIREFLKATPNIPLELELMLILASRMENIKTRILPELQKGKLVLCDRFFYSTVVYQCFVKTMMNPRTREPDETEICGYVDFLQETAKLCLSKKTKEMLLGTISMLKSSVEKRKKYIKLPIKEHKKLYDNENYSILTNIFINLTESINQNYEEIGDFTNKHVLHKIASVANMLSKFLVSHEAISSLVPHKVIFLKKVNATQKNEHCFYEKNKEANDLSKIGYDILAALMNNKPIQTNAPKEIVSEIVYRKTLMLLDIN